MRITTKTAVLVATFALGAAPAQALPPQAPDNNETQHAPAGGPASDHATPGPNASLPEKAAAYGRHCRGFSRKHVAGTPGTPFSRCVTAMAKLATDRSRSPRRACAGQSKKHVRGEKGTAFSRCVAAGAKLLRARNEGDS